MALGVGWGRGGEGVKARQRDLLQQLCCSCCMLCGGQGVSPRPLAQLLRASVAAVAAVALLLQRVKEREGERRRALAERVKETCVTICPVVLVKHVSCTSKASNLRRLVCRRAWQRALLQLCCSCCMLCCSSARRGREHPASTSRAASLLQRVSPLAVYTGAS